MARRYQGEDSLAGMASALEDAVPRVARWEGRGPAGGLHIAHGVLSKTGSVDDPGHESELWKFRA